MASDHSNLLETEKQALLTLSQIKEDKSCFRNVTITSIMVKKVYGAITVTTIFCKGTAALIKGQLQSMENLSLLQRTWGLCLKKTNL